MMNYDIYCDESGNTGSNFLDTNQPIFVLSGWMFERNTSYKAKEKVIQLRKDNFPQMEELKGAKLLKSSRGRKFCADFFEEMGKMGAVPFFIVAEKRFCVAAKIVEAFFDPLHNDYLENSFSWRNDLKIIIAEIIYSISEESIEKFTEVHQSPTLANIKETQLELIKELKKNGYGQLADVVGGTNSHLGKILEEETYTITGMEKKAMKTLNLPVFISFINLIEKFSRNIGFKKVRMIHDEVAQFQRVFPEVFEMYNKSESNETLVLASGTEMVFSTLKLKQFEMGDSKRHALIQAGDILSSTLNNYFTKVSQDLAIDTELSSVGEFAVGALLVNSEFKGSGLCDLICSTTLKKKIFQSVGINQEGNEDVFRELDIKDFLTI